MNTFIHNCFDIGGIGTKDTIDGTTIDQYKEMVERTRQLHLELLELSSKVGKISDRIEQDRSEILSDHTFGELGKVRSSDISR